MHNRVAWRDSALAHPPHIRVLETTRNGAQDPSKLEEEWSKRPGWEARFWGWKASSWIRNMPDPESENGLKRAQ
jgi:hypothetical protein